MPTRRKMKQMKSPEEEDREPTPERLQLTFDVSDTTSELVQKGASETESDESEDQEEEEEEQEVEQEEEEEVKQEKEEEQEEEDDMVKQKVAIPAKKKNKPTKTLENKVATRTVSTKVPSIYDIVLAAIASSTDKKGITIIVNYPEKEWSRTNTLMKKALMKGLENRSILRVKDSSESLGIKGWFKINKIVSQTVEKKAVISSDTSTKYSSQGAKAKKMATRVPEKAKGKTKKVAEKNNVAKPKPQKVNEQVKLLGKNTQAGKKSKTEIPKPQKSTRQFKLFGKKTQDKENEVSEMQGKPRVGSRKMPRLSIGKKTSGTAKNSLRSITNTKQNKLD
ncbi:hypothetical protein Hamer_G023635 [Homarus americanus]|uniref:Uncharacterized protein n=1 Tax=Homarus americanus TaxID=6706 RepID=A0A8J5JET0_HOMAM|nr:hypothetical protein Hamer_G023635 [Homarus americanus]